MIDGNKGSLMLLQIMVQMVMVTVVIPNTLLLFCRWMNGCYEWIISSFQATSGQIF